MAIEDFLLVDDREVVLTDAMHVRYDRGDGPLGHPREFMTLETDGEATCNLLRPALRPPDPRRGRGLRAASRPFAA